MPTKRTRTAKSTTTPSTSRKTTTPKVEAPMIVRSTPVIRRAPSCDEIGQRAYELFAARGYRNGHDVEDWLQAEHELWAKA